MNSSVSILLHSAEFSATQSLSQSKLSASWKWGHEEEERSAVGGGS